MIRKMEGILAEKVRIIDDADRKKKLTDTEIRELKDLIEAERRKSTAAEKSYNQLQNENKNMKDQLDNLKKAVDKSRE